MQCVPRRIFEQEEEEQEEEEGRRRKWKKWKKTPLKRLIFPMKFTFKASVDFLSEQKVYGCERLQLQVF